MGKRRKRGNQAQTGNQVIYIARIVKEEEQLTLVEITEDAEWVDVQHLLKQIANAQHAG